MAPSPKSSPSLVTTIDQRKRLPSGLGAVLSFTDGDEAGREVALFFERTVLGRKSGDIVVRDTSVSGVHLALEYRKGNFYATDLESSNGTFIGKDRIKKQTVELEQEVRMGECVFHVRLDPARASKLMSDQPLRPADRKSGLSDLIEREFFRSGGSGKSPRTGVSEGAQEKMRLRILTGADDGRHYSFLKPNVTIGRAGADLPLRDQDVSRKHAMLEKGEGGQVILRDLASVNGTKVNDRRVMNCVLASGDRIQVGKSTIVFIGVEKE